MNETKILTNLAALTAEINKRGFSKILLAADENTYAAGGCGAETENALKGRILRTFIFGGERLTPDETAVGKLFIAASEADFIVGVGSGVINDLCRYVSYRLGAEYAIIAAAASMDGYLSSISPLIIKRHKTTCQGQAASYAVFMTKLLKTAPKIMTAAGAGDIFGKAVCLIDWQLSHILFGERYDAAIAAKSRAAADICLDDNNIKEIAANADAGIEKLMDALILTGRAMNEYGDSRPASGAEHHLAHFWEQELLNAGVDDVPLHGVCVGVATLVSAQIMDYIAKCRPVFANAGEKAALYEKNWPAIVQTITDNLPDLNDLKRKIELVGCPSSPSEIGVTPDIYRKSITRAMLERPRFTILRLADDLGILSQFAK